MKSAEQALREVEILVDLAKDGMSVPFCGCGQNKRCKKNNMQIISKEVNSAIAQGEKRVYVSAGQLRLRKQITKGEQIGVLLCRLIRLRYGVSFHKTEGMGNPTIRISWSESDQRRPGLFGKS